jgi:hypothetical protein
MDQILKFRDLKVFLTNRPEDTQMFNELRGLSQAIIQNGGTLYDVIELYSTKSMREMKKTFKDLRDRQVAQQEQQQLTTTRTSKKSTLHKLKYNKLLKWLKSNKLMIITKMNLIDYLKRDCYYQAT